MAGNPKAVNVIEIHVEHYLAKQCNISVSKTENLINTNLTVILKVYTHAYNVPSNKKNEL